MLFAKFHTLVTRRIPLIFSILATAAGMAGSARGEAEAGMKMRIGYVSELPLAWRTGAGDPLQTWAGNLSALFAGDVPAADAYAAANLIGEESWEALSHSVKAGGVDLIPLRAADFLLDAEETGLEALLTSSHGQRTAGTRFVLITADGGHDPVEKIADLENRTVLVDRDGCGDLVDYWLDVLIAKSTGSPRRVPPAAAGEQAQKPFGARFRTVSGASEAVLPVYFREVAACVVSEAALARVIALNPGQMSFRIKEPLARSPVLATHVLAARASLSAADKMKAAKRAAAETLALPSGVCPLLPATAESLAPLRELLTAWKTLQPADSPVHARRRTAVPALRRASSAAAAAAALHSTPATE